jgi:hypothetical protein
LFTRLERYVYSTVAALALCAAVLVAWPAVAQAQAAPAKDVRVTKRVVIRPGDSLWTISSERLGPDATLQQIADEAERIYAHNRDRIGPNPNLLFAGQELSVPAVGEPSAAPTTQTQATIRPARAGQGGDQGGRVAEAPNPTADQPANLPKAPAAATVPAVGWLALAAPTGESVASLPETVRFWVASAVAETAGTFAEGRSRGDERRLFGLGIIALTFLIASLMAWKLPMSRSAGEWVFYADGYYAGGDYTCREQTLDLHEGAAASAPGASGRELIVNGSEAEAPETAKGVSRVGPAEITQQRRERIRRGRARGLKRLPRGGLLRAFAAGAYGHEVRRSWRERVREGVPGSRSRAPRNGRVKTARQIMRGR